MATKLDPEAKITGVRITARAKTILDELPGVHVQVDGGERFSELFTFFPDEINFEEEELLGKTVREAHELKFKKDQAYLRS